MGGAAFLTAFVITCLLLAGMLPATGVWLGVTVGLLAFYCVVG